MAASSQGNTASTADREYFTVARESVIDAAGHWLGNLFQRLRAVEQVLERERHALASALSATAAELDEVMRLVLDYIAYIPPGLQRLPGDEFANTLMRALATRFSVKRAACAVGADLPPVLVNPAAFSLVVQYLPRFLCYEGLPARAEVAFDLEQAPQRLGVRLRAIRGRSGRTTASELYCAVIEKYMAEQGGEFTSTARNGDVAEWTLWLPRQK